MMKPFPSLSLLARAFALSVPVLLGYVTIGIAFGLLLADAGYPWWLALGMSIVMYTGAGQFIAVGLFAAGTSLAEACIVQFVLSARHMAYGLSMLKRFPPRGFLRAYLIYSLSDETFALLSSFPDEPDRIPLMAWTSFLDQCYWVCGSLIGAVAGTLIPFDLKGIDFALSALFLVLLIEQINRVRKAPVFLISGGLTILAAVILPARISLLSALVLSLLASALWKKWSPGSRK